MFGLPRISTDVWQARFPRVADGTVWCVCEIRSQYRYLTIPASIERFPTRIESEEVARHRQRRGGHSEERLSANVEFPNFNMVMFEHMTKKFDFWVLCNYRTLTFPC